MKESVLGKPNEVGNNNIMERKDPKRAIMLLERMSEGQSYRRIMRETGCDWPTLVGLKGRHLKILEERRAEVAEGALQVAEAARMLVHEKLADIASDPEKLAATSLKDLMVTYGIGVDKHFAALGEAQKHVVEHKVDATSLEDAAKAIAEAKERVRMKMAIDVTPGKTEDGA